MRSIPSHSTLYYHLYACLNYDIYASTNILFAHCMYNILDISTMSLLQQLKPYVILNANILINVQFNLLHNSQR